MKSNVIERIKERAKEKIRKIVLPESNDIRVLKAAEIIQKEKIAIPILIGDNDDIKRICEKEKIDLSGIDIVNPLTFPKYNEYVNMLYELRKGKGLKLSEANDLVKDYVYFGVCMVKTGDADGLVSGAAHSTADTLRPALQIIKSRNKDESVSSFFLMNIPDSKYGKEYIFSDCGLIPFPTTEQLATIAKQAAKSCEDILEKKPVVALLSYSTYGSASSEHVEKVKQAKAILDREKVDFEYDGELQLDTALEPNVAKIKAPECRITGRPNVLIFPNIEAGNIGYKLVERFANADAIGPITQGLAKPINDLSRGCKVDDIVVAVAITSLQSE
ncbi:MAG: phosphate acetyltransferase [Clostridia bacterium]|nr:phosphate acetyltransferase [Clostridia bacterium]